MPRTENGPVRRRRRVALLALPALVLLLCCSTCIRCAAVRHGHVVSASRAPNHDTDFDFERPPCEPAPRAKTKTARDEVAMRYLGVSGLYVEWRGESILTAPFFSNYGRWQAGFGDVHWDEDAISAGLAGLDLSETGALLLGHSHYDHIGDLPPIALDYAPRSRIYVNRSGAYLLAAFEELASRVQELQEIEGRWTRLRDAEGRELPFRILPVRAEHSDHYHGYHYADGKVAEPWNSWRGRALRGMKEGEPYALLIDLLEADGETVAFRIYYQDAVSPPTLGLPPAAEVAAHAIDLAMLCITPWWEVKGQPEAVLRATRPRHVLVTHYGDFMQPPDRPLRFVATLTDARVDRFLATVEREHAEAGVEARGPASCGCGPCGAIWSMPLPGEWMEFRVDD